uniref:Serine/threonine-protein kinase 11-interacting protein n=1 Tax=Oryza glumipatula TaxID=40148 RepID=A0A0D9Z438_9ORYZ
MKHHLTRSREDGARSGESDPPPHAAAKTRTNASVAHGSTDQCHNPSLRQSVRLEPTQSLHGKLSRFRPFWPPQTGSFSEGDHSTAIREVPAETCQLPTGNRAAWLHGRTPSPSVPSPTSPRVPNHTSAAVSVSSSVAATTTTTTTTSSLPGVRSAPIRRCGGSPNPSPIPTAAMAAGRARGAPPVTGDRYLDLLVRFVGRNAGALLDGSVTLRLHPVGLHYVASRLEALRELEAVGAGAPVDYLRAYVADLGDHRALEQLRRILRLLTSLKVVAPGPGRDPAPLSLVPFARLRVLELRGCDLSTSAARGLLDLRHTLEKLICYNSTDALRHIFTSRIMDIKDSPVWGRLLYVSCASNGLVLMDESLQLLPAVETLDLSRNQFAKVDNLRKCTKLRNLDLGFNHLRSISSLSEACGRIVQLVLRNNALTTLHGIKNLKSLMDLDLSYNIISNFSELEILGSLFLLQNLWLEGNPICCARWYRARVFSFLHNSESLKLDDKGMNTQEYWEKQVLFSSRQKQPAGYGFYFPAKDDHEDEDTSNSKMKKISRLALIVEEERSLCDEGVDQQTTPHESDSSKKDEVAAADNDIKITSLINTAELLKKEKSTDWLREFKEWMDENMENTEPDNLYIEFNSSNGRYEEQKKMQKAQKNSKDISDLVQTSEGGSSSNILESDLSFTDGACYSANGVTTESSHEGNIYQAPLKLHLNSSQQFPPLNFVAISHADSFCEMEDGTGNLHTNGVSSNLMNKLVEPSLSFTNSSPQSPPQYKEDILHRRLCMEEEVLQTSGDFNCAGSLGSGSSCSDDSSGDLCSCNSEDDCVAIRTKMELSLNGQIARFSSVGDYEEKDGMEYFSGKKGLPDYSAEDVPNFTDSVEFGIKQLHDRYKSNGHLGEGSDHLVRQQSNQKFKMRIPPLFKNHNGTKLVFPKVNGDEMDNGVSVAGNGHLGCNLNNCTLCREHSLENHNSSILHKDNLCASANTVSCNTEKYKLIEDFFNLEIASDASEICEKTAFCGYIFQNGTGSDLVQSYWMEDLENILIGLGLQALRVHMADNTTHLFLTRTSKEAEDILWLLTASNFPQLTSSISLQSWEKVQLKLLENCIHPSLEMGIFLYSLLMFWKNDTEEGSFVIRSLAVTEGSLFVCIENIHQFGSLPDDPDTPYFSLDACCLINDIQEVVVDHCDKRCLTLVLDNHAHEGRFCSNGSITNSQSKQPDEIYTVHTWKLKWFSEETVVKFISLLKALYSVSSSSSLPVKCTS